VADHRLDEHDTDRCECGHIRDEHDANRACTVDDDLGSGEPSRCPCFHFDPEGTDS